MQPSIPPLRSHSPIYHITQNLHLSMPSPIAGYLPISSTRSAQPLVQQP